MNALTFTCSMPPTTNNCYFNSPHGGRVLTKEARNYKDKLVWGVYELRRKVGWQYVGGMRLAMVIYFHFAIDAKGRSCDIANREKLMIDAIAEALGFDDSIIDEILLKRGEKKAKACCAVRLKPFGEPLPITKKLEWEKA